MYAIQQGSLNVLNFCVNIWLKKQVFMKQEDVATKKDSKNEGCCEFSIAQVCHSLAYRGSNWGLIIWLSGWAKNGEIDS